MLGPGTGYVDLLDQATNQRIREDAEMPRKASPLRPSAAGSCTRSLAYGLMEYHGRTKYDCPPFSPSVYRLLNLGSAIENHVIEQLENSGFKAVNRQQLLKFGSLESNVDPSLNQTVQGSIDFLLIHKEHRCVADVKSVGGAKQFWNAKTKLYKTMKSVQTLSDQAFWIEDVEAFIVEVKDPFLTSNLAQLNFYANNEWIQSLGIDHAVVLQYAKCDSQLRELRFRPSRALFEKSFQKFQIALESVAVGKPALALRDHLKDSVACRYCRYEAVCKNDSEEYPRGKTKKE